MANPLSPHKARGAFFTPPEISRFISDWAIRSQSDLVLEPSCGEASFLQPAGARLKSLSSSQYELNLGQLTGVEIHEASVRAAHQVLGEHGLSADIQVADFFDVTAQPIYDAVIGNPPYIRYQQFSGAARAKSLQAALAHGVRLTGLASSWAAFVIHASQFLKSSGRLGLVLPAELLSVNYAAGVRRFLLNRFAKVRLVMFEELVFPNVLEEVVLLLAEGTGPGECFEVFQARDLSDLSKLAHAAWTGFTPERDGKWTPALIPTKGLESYQRLKMGQGFEPMLNWGETYLGAVTGNNRYFTLTRDEVQASQLGKSEVLAISPPGSRHLRGLRFTEAAWEELARSGACCYLFAPKIGRPSIAAQQYIALGEADGVNLGYKCRMRDPWWRVPTVTIPDLLLTYMDHDRPRLVANDAGVYHLNSLYGVSLRYGRQELGRDLIPLASLNSVTLLGAEMVGRSYGGGLLKLEPSEADKLPLPSEAALQSLAPRLRALRPQLNVDLREGRLTEAAEKVDELLLREYLGATEDELHAIRDAREVLFSRRVARGNRSVRAED